MNSQPRSPIFSPKLVFGLTLIALGVILTGESLQWFDAWRLLAWWPLALAAFGCARMVQDGFLSLRGHFWLGLSLAGFISQFGPWGLLERWWPSFLVWGGAILTLRAIFPQARRRCRGQAVLPSPNTSSSGDPETNPTTVKP